MKIPKSNWLKNISFKKKKKGKPLKKLENYKLYKEQAQLDFWKKRKSYTLSFQLHKQKEKIKKIFIFGTVFFLVLLFFGTLYIFSGPTFRVKIIKIEKTDGLTDLNIAYKSLDDIRGSLIFSINKDILFEKITSYQENIASLHVQKILPNTLEIWIASYEPAFNISIDGKKYLLLENGSIVPTQNFSPDHMILWIVNHFGTSNFLSYKKIYDEKFIQKIQNILAQTKLNIPAPQTANYYENERELHILFDNKTRVIVSVDEDISIDEQIKNLAIMHKENNAILSGENVYIDLRVKGRAFSCSFENEGTCRRNLNFLYPEIERPKLWAEN